MNFHVENFSRRIPNIVHIYTHKHTPSPLPHLKQFNPHGPHFEPQITKVNVLQPEFVIYKLPNVWIYHTYFVSKTKQKDRKNQKKRKKKTNSRTFSKQ